jgi:hypothetical protein
MRQVCALTTVAPIRDNDLASPLPLAAIKLGFMRQFELSGRPIVVILYPDVLHTDLAFVIQRFYKSKLSKLRNRSREE